MSILNPKRKQKPERDLRQASLLVSVPAILFAAPLVGFLIGYWADKKLGTAPYLTGAGALLGVAAAGIEIYQLIKKASAIDKEKDKDDTKPGS